MGDNTKAISFCKQSLELHEKILGKDHFNCASIVDNLGGYCAIINKDKEAESYLLRGLAIPKKVFGANHPKYAYSLNNLGVFYLDKGQYEKAKVYIKEVLRIGKAVLGKNSLEYANSLQNLGALFVNEKDFEQAEETYTEALDILRKKLPMSHPSCISTLNNLAVIAKNSKQIAKGWNHIRQALEVNLGLELDSTVHNWNIDSLGLATYSFSEGLNRSLVIAFQLLEMEDKKLYKSKKIALIELALKFQKKYKKNLTTEEAKLRILTQNSEWVLFAMNTLDEAIDAEKALQFVEQNKSVLLLDSVSNKQVYVRGLLPPSLIEKEQQLQDDYSKTQAALVEKRSREERDRIRSRFTQIHMEMDVFRKEIHEKYPKYSAMRYQSKPLEVAELQTQLDDQTALLEYLIGDSSVYVFFVDNQTVEMHELVLSPIVLKQKVEKLHDVLSNYELLTRDERKSYKKYIENAFWC